MISFSSSLWHRLGLACALIAGFCALPAMAQKDEDEEPRIAVMRGLDKTTARVGIFDAAVGEPVRFGTLEILVQTCRTRPPEEPPETTAFIEITDIGLSNERNRVFTGWMFASSPALNAVEHPVYDVWLISCKTPDP